MATTGTSDDAFTRITLPGGGAAGGRNPGYALASPEENAAEEARIREENRRIKERETLRERQSGSSPDVRTDLQSPGGVRAPAMKNAESPAFFTQAPLDWARINAQQDVVYRGAESADEMRGRALGNADGLYQAGNQVFAGRDAPTSDYSGIAPYRRDQVQARQQGLGYADRFGGGALQDMTSETGFLRQQARGLGGPSVAEAQLARGRDDSVENAMALANSGPGGRFNPAAQRAAVTEAARAQQTFAQGQGALRAQEMQAAQSALGQNLASRASGANALAGTMLGQQQYDLQGQGMAQGRADTLANQEFRQRQLDDQTAMGFYGAGQGQDALALNANQQRLGAYGTVLTSSHQGLDLMSRNHNAHQGIRRDMRLGRKGDDDGSNIWSTIGTVGGGIIGGVVGGPGGAVAGASAGGALGGLADEEL